ncbi:HAD-IIB family hydrolase [Simiduia sp. 21SJ11W-1]|uniref:HAD-IIB family hydrolase n=1 Tax=Simiduia sp. 21SJ11W-1 TaxID=2909669 RepID=UPI00209DA547|nr:HAD-IIB family hydrolase [Simiduia sp. 21SJ11W-1]UTA49070.1 HAD-IIB family hydrolase [Simiduia sp. 21SJ11W-1]
MQTLVFTDLDGTLLDHHNYSFEPAKAQLNELREQGIPLICNTSKTFAELLPLREKLGNHAPFITENGAGVYLPLHFLPERAIHRLGNASLQHGYWRFGLSHPRSYWQMLLAQAKAFHGLYASFQQMGSKGIAQTTGLSAEAAALANQREFSEPLLWLGDNQSKRTFAEHMHQMGAKVVEGGRFLHIVGNSDKGKALRWLAGVYEYKNKLPTCTLAAGDGANDAPMLQAADHALVVRSPVNPPPEVPNHPSMIISEAPGPAGWAPGIAQLLARVARAHSECSAQ